MIRDTEWQNNKEIRFWGSPVLEKQVEKNAAGLCRRTASE